MQDREALWVKILAIERMRSRMNLKNEYFKKYPSFSRALLNYRNCGNSLTCTLSSFNRILLLSYEERHMMNIYLPRRKTVSRVNFLGHDK